MTLQCRLSDYDRRTVKEGLQAAELTPAQGVDYFENLCLQGELCIHHVLIHAKKVQQTCHIGKSLVIQARIGTRSFVKRVVESALAHELSHSALVWREV